MTVENVAQIYSPYYREERSARLWYEGAEQQISSGFCWVWRLVRIEYLA